MPEASLSPAVAPINRTTVRRTAKTDRCAAGGNAVRSKSIAKGCHGTVACADKTAVETAPIATLIFSELKAVRIVVMVPGEPGIVRTGRRIPPATSRCRAGYRYA